MNKSIQQIKDEALQELSDAANPESVQELSVKYLGRKGQITLFLRSISELPPEERPMAAKQANEVKVLLGKAFQDAANRFNDAALESKEGIDVWLPGRLHAQGALHPITLRWKTTTSILKRSTSPKTILLATCRTHFMSPITLSSGPIRPPYKFAQ